MAYPNSLTVEERNYILEDIHDRCINAYTRELFLHSDIDAQEEEEPGIDYRNTNRFLKNIRFLESIAKDDTDDIVVHQNTFGGDEFHGMMVYDAIQHCSVRVHIIMHGTAMSMGSLIPQAADTRIIMPNCGFMVHQGDMSNHSTVKIYLAWAEWLKKDRDRMMNVYANKCVKGQYFKDQGWSVKRVKTFIKKKMDEKEDWILDAHEAVSYGFADGVFGEGPYKTLADIRHR